jgi:NDP-sugar pyrophosphorylase family protein
VSPPRVCVIAAAGSGERLHPRSARVPKVLLEVGGKALLTRQLELVRDELGIRKVYLVVGHLGDQIRAAYRDGRDLGLEIHYVEHPDFRRGLGTALLAVEPHVQEPFVFLLGDECYLETNLRELPHVDGSSVAVCGVLPGDDPEVVGRTHVVTIAGDRITGLAEQRAPSASEHAGCGAYVLTPAIYRFAHETPPSPGPGRLALSAVLDRAARAGAELKPFVVRGHYVDVDTIEDLHAASYLCRSLHFERHRVSVVVPTYNEAASIGAVLRDFAPHVWEMVVVDNCSPDGTADIARSLGATVISRPTRGFGDAVKHGLDTARGDILVMVEADGTFRAKDLGKLLEFLKDADMVIGTRTTRELVESGANMDGVLRFANILWGKIIEALWWNLRPRYTDVGCTYRALWRDAYLAIRDSLVSDDAPFLPEMVIEMMRARRRVIEIPVNYYRRRTGESKYSGSLRQSARTGMQMMRTIVRRRLGLA